MTVSLIKMVNKTKDDFDVVNKTKDDFDVVNKTKDDFDVVNKTKDVVYDTGKALDKVYYLWYTINIVKEKNKTLIDNYWRELKIFL